MMPEEERDTGFDPSEEVAWDADNSLEMWQDGADDDGIGGYAPCESL
jgi:hypothetical protein